MKPRIHHSCGFAARSRGRDTTRAAGGPAIRSPLAPATAQPRVRPATSRGCRCQAIPTCASALPGGPRRVRARPADARSSAVGAAGRAVGNAAPSELAGPHHRPVGGIFGDALEHLSFGRPKPDFVPRVTMNELAILVLLPQSTALPRGKLASLAQIAVSRVPANARESGHLSNIKGRFRAAHEQIAEFGAYLGCFLREKGAALTILAKPCGDRRAFRLSVSVRHSDTTYHAASSSRNLMFTPRDKGARARSRSLVAPAHSEREGEAPSRSLVRLRT